MHKLSLLVDPNDSLKLMCLYHMQLNLCACVCVWCICIHVHMHVVVIIEMWVAVSTVFVSMSCE